MTGATEKFCSTSISAQWRFVAVSVTHLQTMASAVKTREISSMRRTKITRAGLALVLATSLLPWGSLAAIGAEPDPLDQAQSGDGGTLVPGPLDPTPTPDPGQTGDSTPTVTPEADPDVSPLADEEELIPFASYSLLGCSSEAPYGSEGDGTCAAALNDRQDHMWSAKYTTVEGQIVPEGGWPQWLAFDLGKERDLTALNYWQKQTNGAVKEYEVYVSNDSAVAGDPGNFELWGDPAATGELPAGIREWHQIPLTDAPLAGRYVLFAAYSTYANAPGATMLQVSALVDDDPTGGEDVQNPATPAPITVGDLTVNVAEEFPQVVNYQLGDATLQGNPSVLDTFTLNGSKVKFNTVFDGVAGNRASWTSTTDNPNWTDLTLSSSVTVDESGVVTFRIDSIAGADEANVQTIAIPGHRLASVASDQAGATLARTWISTDSTTNADRILPITGSTELDPSPVNTPYAFASTAELAAGVYSNSTVQQGASNTNQRLNTQILKSGEATVATVQAGTWTWNPKVATDARVERYELPEATVVISADQNEDARVDWQDAAISLRDAIEAPLGADRVPERVVHRIPFNIASEGTNPFLTTLDYTKRLALATDGLGQYVLLKGYTSEGHDSANTDYAGNYNEGAGGLDALNQLIDTGKEDYNADFSVHVNATEIYQQARSFNDLLTNNGASLGWNWLNQAYIINQNVDLGQGFVLDRFQQLRREVPNLDGVYIDVWYSSGWIPEALAGQLQQMTNDVSDEGFELASEWAYSFEGNSIWSHWANDKNYGGPDNKGINSQMIRFMFNTQRDVWNVDPLLGGVDMHNFEGWGGKTDWNDYYRSLWTSNLPAKYLQHFPVLSWEQGTEAKLADGVEISTASGERVITQNGAEVLRGDSYLLPWSELDANRQSSPVNADKMYFFSASGGSHTFDLVDAFAGVSSFDVYQLTETGRESVGTIASDGSTLTISGEANTPYVVVPAGGTAPYADVDYGQYSGLQDPGFNSEDLSVWNPTGDAVRGHDAKGDGEAHFGEAASSLSQTLTGLTPGKEYWVEAMVQVGPEAKRDFTLSAGDASRTINVTPARNTVGSDPKNGSFLQRMGVKFTAPANGEVELLLSSPSGSARVVVDNVRLIELKNLTDQFGEEPLDSLVDSDDSDLFWDFEDNRVGYGPFVRGGSGGLSDARLSKSILHDPYTQKEWKNTHTPYNSGSLNGIAVDDVVSGTRSLKSHEDYNGLNYRTTPATVDFLAGHQYRVSFSYQATHSDTYEWVLGKDELADGSSTIYQRIPIQQALDTTRFEHEFVAGCGDTTFVGLNRAFGLSGADFVLDDFLVEDLGVSSDAPACGSTEGRAPGDLTIGHANEVTTSFTNLEKKTATNVAMQLTDVPEGWKVEVKEQGGNLFDSVAPGETVETVWLVTPIEAETYTLGFTTDYAVDCIDRHLTGQFGGKLTTRAAIPAQSIKATASSEQPGSGGEGPIHYALDGDTSTIWHTNWTPSAHPHYATFEFNNPTQIDGYGYMNRQSGGANGRIKDYEIQVSDNGMDWTTVASGQWQESSPDLQVVNFDEVTTKFVRLASLSAWNGQGFSSAAELRVFGVPQDEVTGFEPSERPATDPDACTPDAPEAPLGLTVDGVTYDSITVSWDPVADAEEYVVTFNGQTITTSDTTLVLTNLTESTEYQITVRASNQYGESEDCDPVTATTTEKPVVEPEVPAAPTGVVATKVTASSIALKWDPVEEAAKYVVTYSAGGAPQSTFTAETSDPSIVLSSLKADTEYTITVQAVNEAGQSDPSSALKVRTLKQGESPVTPPAPGEEDLPVTGGAIAGLVVLAAALIGAGTLFYRRRRIG